MHFDFMFVLAGVESPIIGFDFLTKHCLLVDPATRQVLVAATMQPVGKPLPRPCSSPLAAALLPAPPPVRKLLSRFPTIIGDSAAKWQHPLHNITHSIEMTGRPITATARRLVPDRQRLAQQELNGMEEAGIIRRSKSPWASPLHMVP